MNTIQSEWESYVALIVPLENPMTQESLQRAFYAGASAIFRLVAVAAAEANPDAGQAMCAGIEAEIDDFLEKCAAPAIEVMLDRQQRTAT